MNKFIIDNIEYFITKNPHTCSPMIARVDGFLIENRKEICRKFLKSHGWTDDMFKNRVTNDLERKINMILNKEHINENILQVERIQNNNIGIMYNKTYSEETINKIVSASTDFYIELGKDDHGRFRSWEHNYKVFHDARMNENYDYDYLSLHLSFYLASWGMYRGSSFLLQKDYRIHIPVIKELLNHKYDILCGIKCSEYRNIATMNLLFELADFISSYYEKIREEVKEKEILNDISETLVTKVLMGVLGCCPAYDRYFKEGLAKEHIGIKRFNAKAMMELVDFYEANLEKFEETRNKMNVEGLPYPQMKLIDMGFWKIGFDADDKKGFKKSH